MRRAIAPNVLLSLMVSACFLGGSTSDQPPPPNGDAGTVTQACAFTFTADPPETYVAKIKNVLVGLPPTDAEIASVKSGGDAALAALVDTWMTGSTFAPLYQAKMLAFFENAFQQTQINSSAFTNQIGAAYASPNSGAVQNHAEMFARTMLALNAQGAPFNQSISTSTYMMTTELKSYFGFLDTFGIPDPANKITIDTIAATPPAPKLYVRSSGVNDPSTLQFVDPALIIAAAPDHTGTDPACTTQLVFKPSAFLLYGIMTGSYPVEDLNHCKATKTSAQLTASDYTDWSLVTISEPSSGTAPPFAFYDLAKLRAGGANAAAMVLNRPNVGFFTTPAFFANWQSNDSNQMRVTTNQALIVALGAQVDGTDPTVASIDPLSYGMTSAHAAPNTQCSGCHSQLDPTREIFANTFTWYYGYAPRSPEPSVNWSNDPSYFVFQGVQAPMSTMQDFGKILSNHPLLPSAWAQRLCYYVNSAPCHTDDPEFKSIVQAFTSSSFSWDKLVKAVVTSPITTHVASTESVTSADNCGPVSVSRLDHLCAALNARFGFKDVCQQDALNKPFFGGVADPGYVLASLPSDGYGRGTLIPILPNQPTLFYRIATEDLCEYLAPLVIDTTQTWNTWASATCTATSCPAIGSSCAPNADGLMSCATVGDFVTIVAGLPSTDPRASLVAGALLTHFSTVLAQPATKKLALESAFVAACMSPSAISIGL